MNCSKIAVVTGFSVFNILLTLISVATPGWMLIEDNANGNASASKIVGLWNDETITVSHHIVRGLLLLGVLFQLLATYFCVRLARLENVKHLYAVTAFIVSGFIIAFALIVYTGFVGPGLSFTLYSYSYIIGWISFATTFSLATSFACIETKKEQPYFGYNVMV